MATMQSLLDALKARRGKAYYDEFVAFMQQVTDDYNDVADRFIATSSSAVTVGSGSKSFTLSANGKSFAVGSYVMAYKTSDPSVYMIGQVAAFSDPTLTISVAAGSYSGSGSVSDWTIALSAKPATDLSPSTVTPTGGYSAASLATLTGASQTMARQTVVMVRTADGGSNPSTNPATWVVLKPDGTLLGTTGTVTQGLQEAIDYAQRYGFNLEVHGGPIKPVVWGVPYGGDLGTNPFTTSNGSAVVTVAHTAHGLSTGNTVFFTGVGSAVNGIPASQFATFRSITVVNANSYTITMDSGATSSGTSGGSSVRYQHGGQDPAIINCSAPITFAPIQKQRFVFYGTTLNFSGSPVGSPFAITLDSAMMAEFNFGGQIVYGGAYGGGIRIYPRNECPSDPYGPVFGATYLRTSSIVSGSGNGVNVQFDATVAPITLGDYEFMEPNGGDVGIRVVMGAGKGFNYNKITAIGCHLHDVASVQVGTSTTGATGIYGNEWDLFLSPAAGADALSIYGTCDTYRVTILDDEGVPTTGITLQSTADRNAISVLRNEATTPFSDLSTAKSNRIDIGREVVVANRNNSNQSSVASGVWTKVAFNATDYSTYGNFDTTNSRFTPAAPGFYSVHATVKYTTASDQAPIAAAIYKNGTVAFKQWAAMSGTNSGQSVSVTSSIYLTTSDYVEIFTIHAMGSDRIIDGSSSDTYLQIERVC